MLSSSISSVRLACGCVVLLAAPTLRGQEPKPVSGAPKPETTDVSPSDAAAAADTAKPAAKNRAAKKPAAAQRIDLPSFDFARLAHPSVAEQLELTDEQRAEVARIINRRATQLAAAAPTARKSILDEADQRLAALLSEGQRAKLDSLEGEQKLRFNFREQKWTDVLDWFARQAGMSLVMDKSPPGAFTYTNNRDYSPTEAIDLLNSVLLTKGFSLLQRGRMLILVDLADDLPTNLIPRVTEEEISEHGDFEIVRVMFALAGRAADEVANEIQPLIGNYGSCLALPKTGQLLVTETAGKMRAISILIASIPKPKQPEKPKEKEKRPEPPPPVLVVYPVTQIKPASAVETLAILFPAAKFTVDDKAQQVMAYARPTEQVAIKGAVEQMEANRSTDRQPRLEVYTIDLPDGEQLVEQLHAVLPEVQATVDTTLGRLLVFATPQDQDTVKEMLQKLDAHVDTGSRQVVVYQLKHFDPTTLAELINQLDSRTDVSTDALLRRVVVSAGPAQQAMIKSLVEQLDQESALEDKPLLQIYALKKPADVTLVTTLKAIIPDATITLATDGRQLSVVARVVDQTVVKKMVDQWVEVASGQEEPELKIYPLKQRLSTEDLATIKSLVPDAQSTVSTDGRQLTVIARAMEQTAVQTLVERLTEAAAAVPKPELKVYPLKHVFTAADVTNLMTLVPGAKIALATDGRQLRVTALADEHQELDRLIQQYETAAASEVKPALSVIPLGKTLNPTVMATLQTLVPQAKLTISTDKKELIVVARDDELATIKETLDQIEVSADAAHDQQLKIYQLDGLSAVELQKLLQALVVHSTITVDTPQDRLIVWGPAEEHAAFAAVIEQLTQDPLVGTKPVLQFYSLADQTQFSNIATVLTSLVPQAKLTWDEEAKRAMVIATPKDHQSMRQTIDEILKNVEPYEEQVLRLYTLSPTQQTRFDAIQADVVKGLPGMRVIKDPQTGELAIWAKASQHDKLTEVLDQLKSTGESTARRLLIGYPINSGSAETVFEMLQPLFPGVTFTLDAKADRIFAYAPLSEQGRIKQTVSQMDVEGTPSNQEELRSYSTGGVNPSPLVVTLQKLVPDMQLTPDNATKKVMAWGTVRDHEVLGKAIEQLRNGDPAQRPVIKAYPMPGRDIRSLIYMRSVLLEVVPDAAITIDGRGGSIVASATEEDHVKLKEAIDEIVKLDRSDNYKLEVYTLDKLTATQVQRALRPIVPDAEITAGEDPRQIVVWATAEDHERIVAALAKLEEAEGTDGQRVLRLHRVRPTVATQVGAFIARTLPNMQVLTGRGSDQVLVWGTPNDQDRLAAIIEQMDHELGNDAERVMKTYELNDVDATEAKRVLDSAIGNLEYVLGNDPAQLVIWAAAPAHEEVAKLLDELKQAVATPRQMLKVHRFDEDELDVTTVYDALAPEEIKDLSIQVNTETNSLIVRGPAARQVEFSEMLVDLVEQLPKADKPTSVVYRLDRADPLAASRLLRSLLPAAPVAYDIVNRTIAVTATAREQAKVKEVVDQLDNKDGEELVTETYVMKRGNPTAVMTALKPIVPHATISSDVYNKMLIITATAEEHQQIKAIVERADGEGDGTISTKAYPLKYANAYTISTALTRVVPAATVSADALNKMLVVTATEEDHKRIQAVLDQADMRGGGELETKAYMLYLANPSTISVALRAVVPNAIVSPDTVNKMLVVTASAEDQKRVQAIVDEADRRSEGELITTVYSLKFANPLALSYSIKPIAPNATASPDIYNKTIIVTATAKDHQRIKTIIDQADSRGGGDLTTKAYSLKWANATTISTALTAVVPNAKISSDTINKMLVVTANQEDHAKIQEVLDEADKRGGGELVTRAYTLQTANPTTIMLALRPVVPDATVSSDITNKMLVVTASEEDHLKIAAVVDEADHREDGELLTEIYPLKWANPMALSYSLRPIAPNATISPDTYNKSLFVTGTAKDHARIKPVVEQADQRGGGELTTKAYALQLANPSTIALALRSVVPNATVSPDSVNKMLIVTASDEDQQRIQAIVDEADRRSEGEMTTEVYSLKFANPTALSYSIKPIAPNATASPDVYNKTLIVTATAKDHERIKAVIDSADKRGGGDLTTKAYSLKWANPITINTALSAVVPAAMISSDTLNKMLVVTANEEDHAKIQEVLEQADKRGGGDLTTEAYSLRTANPSTIMVALRPVVPDATLSADTLNRVLIATASAEDHLRIKTIVEAADRRGDGELETEAYSLKWADPRTLATALGPVAPNATVTADRTNKTLVVTATKADQELVKKVIDQADRRGDSEMTTEVFLLTRANPVYVSRALTPLVPDATIGADAISKMLIVTAPAEEQEKIKKIVERADRRGDGDLTTKVYPFKLADPKTVALALQTLVPNALVSSDRSTNTLIVTGSLEDHQQIEPLVEQLDVPSPSTPVLKSYSVKNADPREVYTSLSQLFRYNRDVNVGYQEETGMILVFAPGVDQDEVGNALQEIEKATTARPKATLEVYQLEGLDSNSALDTLTTLLEDETPKIEFQVDETNNQILAIAEPEQQAMIREALSRLEPVERDVEVFSLQRVDPYTAESAIDTLFTDLPFAAMPSVEADPDMQQLIVHGTKTQLERIRVLLEKMGEGSVTQKERQSSALLRVIPLSGDAATTLHEIERFWPQLRGNQLKIVTPPAPDERPTPGPSTPPDKTDLPAKSLPDMEPTRPAPAKSDTSQKEAQRKLTPVVFVSTQVPESQGDPEPAVPDDPVPETAGADRPKTSETPQGDPVTGVVNDLPPVVVIAGNGQLTVASRDVEALNQFEELLKTLQHGRHVSFSNGNFSMFLLKNADAEELADTLTSVFRRDSRSSRSSSRSYSQRRTTNLTVVADQRMNALLVYGSSADRETVEEMLEVLDSSDIPDSLTSERPLMIPVLNLPAGTVLSVLQSVYKSQLSTRRGLRPVTIPVGISREMTSMLELVNATANAPILTLDVDEITNSIVMRAPRQLGEEIEEFVKELDERSKDGGTRNISLVPLRGMNSEQIQDALQLLMRGGRYRRSSSSSSSYRSR